MSRSQLPETHAIWQSGGDPGQALKKEFEQLSPAELPLQEGLTHSSAVSGNSFSVVVLNTEANSKRLEAKVGIFYRGIIAGCNCADDPSPVDEVQEYCELMVVLEPDSAEAGIMLLAT